MISSDDHQQTVETRARQSLGTSSDPVYQMVVRTLAQRYPGGAVLVNVDCDNSQIHGLLYENFSG